MDEIDAIISYVEAPIGWIRILSLGADKNADRKPMHLA